MLQADSSQSTLNADIRQVQGQVYAYVKLCVFVSVLADSLSNTTGCLEACRASWIKVFKHRFIKTSGGV